MYARWQGQVVRAFVSVCSQVVNVVSTHVWRRCFHTMSMSVSLFSLLSAASSSSISAGCVSSSLCVLAETCGSATSFQPPQDKSDRTPVSSMPRSGRSQDRSKTLRPCAIQRAMSPAVRALVANFNR